MSLDPRAAEDVTARSHDRCLPGTMSQHPPPRRDNGRHISVACFSGRKISFGVLLFDDCAVDGNLSVACWKKNEMYRNPV